MQHKHQITTHLELRYGEMNLLAFAVLRFAAVETVQVFAELALEVAAEDPIACGCQRKNDMSFSLVFASI